MAMLALTAAAVAQEKKKESVPAAPILSPPAIVAGDADEAYEELVAAYNKARQEFFREWREARAKDESTKFDATKRPSRVFVIRFRELAERSSGTDTAVDAWVMYMRCNGDREVAKEVLLRDHIASKKMVNALSSFGRGEENLALLSEVAKKSPHREVKGVAYFLQGQNLMRSGKSMEAGHIFVMCQWKYGDVPLYRGRTTVGRKAASALFEARNLAIGQEAPDIEGEDVDGVVFKLSDYRGKVILLDFWGDW